MLGGIFRWMGSRGGNQAIVDRIHQSVVEAARNPVFYSQWGVPDTFDGRFDCVTLHAVLLMKRLQALPQPADDLASDVVDRLFLGFEDALRELGVGDVVIPKRMKTIAAAYLGRAKAYEEAMRTDEAALRTVLRRNLLGAGADDARVGLWVDYLERMTQHLSACDLDRIIRAEHLFVDPL